MKLIVSTAVALVLAGQAFAGDLVFEAPEEPVVVAEPAPMGGSNAAWLIPVIGLAAIAYAISNDDDDDDDDTTRHRRRRLYRPSPEPRLAAAPIADRLGQRPRRCPFSLAADCRGRIAVPTKRARSRAARQPRPGSVAGVGLEDLQVDEVHLRPDPLQAAPDGAGRDRRSAGSRTGRTAPAQISGICTPW